MASKTTKCGKRSRTKSSDILTNLNKKQNLQSSPQLEKMSDEEKTELKSPTEDTETKVGEDVTIKAVMDSLRLLHTKFDNQAHSIDALHDDIHGSGGIEDRLGTVTETVDTNTENIGSLQEELCCMKEDINSLKELACRQQQEIKSLKASVLDLTVRSMRDNVIFYNIPEQQGNGTEKIEEKVVSALRMVKFPKPEHLQFDRVHRMGGPRGTGKARPIVAKMSSRQADHLLKFAKSIPRADGSLGIARQFPQETRERRQQLWEMGEQEKSKTLDSVETRMTMDSLFVNGQRYSDPVCPPTAHELLLTTKEEKEQLTTEGPKIHFGEQFIHAGSSFIAAAAEVHTIKDVRSAYRIFVSSPGRLAARHNIACYRLYNPETAKTFEGWQDDGEAGAGRSIRDFLRQHNGKNVAVFVSRGSGGTHLGPDRFKIVKQAVKSAMDKMAKCKD